MENFVVYFGAAKNINNMSWLKIKFHYYNFFSLEHSLELKICAKIGGVIFSNRKETTQFHRFLVFFLCGKYLLLLACRSYMEACSLQITFEKQI